MATSSVDTRPQIIAQGEVRVSKAKNKLGRKLSKLADALPAIVRSPEEHAEHCRLAPMRIAKLLARHKQLDSRDATANERQEIACELRLLCAPMFGVALENGNEEPFVVFVSGNVLSDYKRESIPCTVIAMPVWQRFGRLDTIRRTDVNQEYIEQFAASRANDHAMGKAQNACRLARLEGDQEALTVAYYWLWHGSLKVCKDLNCRCSVCERDRTQARDKTTVIEHNLLLSLGTLYLETETRSHFHGSRYSHKMPTASSCSGVSDYGRETYDEMRQRLGMIDKTTN